MQTNWYHEFMTSCAFPQASRKDSALEQKDAALAEQKAELVALRAQLAKG